jgi:hypothetical protein
MRRSQLITFFGGLICLVAYSSCSDQGNPIGPLRSNNPNALVPLEVGNRWTFRITSYERDGIVGWVDTLTFYIRADTIVDGVRWALEGYDGGMAGVRGFRNDTAGYHTTNFEGIEHTYPYPARTGDTVGIWIVLSTDSLVNTPMGVLHCYCYRSYIWYGYPWTELYAPGIGPVYTESVVIPWVGRPYAVETAELISATGPGMPPNKAMKPTDQWRCCHGLFQVMQKRLVTRKKSPGLAAASTVILPPPLIAGREAGTSGR